MVLEQEIIRVAVPEAEGATGDSGMLSIFWRRLRRNKSAMTGLFIILILLFCAAFANWIAPFSYENPAGEGLQSPSWTHLFGTDAIGRDMFSRVIHGTRVALFIGLGSIVLAFTVGLPLGICAGYYGSWFDMIVMRLMDLLLAFPIFLLAIMIMVILGPSTSNVVIALAIVRIPIFARVVRGSVLAVKELDYVDGARSISVSDSRLLFRHVLPNCLAPIIVTASLSMAFAILVEASLSFLGLGTQPPTPSWGFDLKQNLIALEDTASIIIAPGMAIMFTVLGFNLFGDGLRDALDPRTIE
ncbi:MAG: ABC transporter permease [bacterium]|nr:ABC transporter permease [bacterium]